MFFKLIWTPAYFCVRYASFKATSSISNTFWHHLLFLVIYRLFRELNDGEIENHYKMNSENVGTCHGIIISPKSHVQKSREGHGENWTHLVYKLDNLFRSIRVSDENSSVTRALQCFLKFFELQPIFAFTMHHSKRRHQFPTRCDIICCFKVIYRFV